MKNVLQGKTLEKDHTEDTGQTTKTPYSDSITSGHDHTTHARPRSMEEIGARCRLGGRSPIVIAPEKMISVIIYCGL